MQHTKHTSPGISNPQTVELKTHAYDAPTQVGIPISDDELDALFAIQPQPTLVVLAVSGGVDSMAMMHLVSRYLQNQDRRISEFLVATVDHGFRPDAHEEALWVGERATELGFEHKLLRWEGEKPATGIQNAARNARYQLIHGFAASFKRAPTAIMTAHHKGDQAETVLMRLARGTGIDGLAAMRLHSELRTGSAQAKTFIWRPFLAIPKARLKATLERDGGTWRDDPANECTDFERVRIRKARAARDELGLSDDALARTARRAGRAQHALTVHANEQFKSAVDLNDGAYARVAASFFKSASEEIGMRVLALAIQALTGHGRSPNLAKLESAYQTLFARMQCQSAPAAITLGGCVIAFPPAPTSVDTGGAQDVLVFRETERQDLPEQTLAPGDTETWDNRFKVSLPAAAKKPLTVRALGSAGLEIVRARDPDACRRLGGLPVRATLSVPSFWDGDTLVSVPHLDVIPPPYANTAPTVRFYRNV